MVQDVIFADNALRHSGGGFNIAGPDNEAGVSQPSRRILIRNNLIEDIDGKVGEGREVVPDSQRGRVRDDRPQHGIATGNIYVDGLDTGLNVGLAFTNNIVAHNAYGVIGTDTGTGLSTLNRWWRSYVFKKT